MLVMAPTMSVGALTMLGRVVLAVVFLTAGVAKLADRSGTRRSLLDFGCPSWLAAPLSIGVPIAELMVAATLPPVASARAGAAAAFLLLVAFSITIATAIARGRRVECRCFGQLTSGIVSWRTLARNIVLAAIALTVLLAGLGTPPSSLVDFLAGLSGATLVVSTVGLSALALAGLVVGASYTCYAHTAGFFCAWRLWSCGSSAGSGIRLGSRQGMPTASHPALACRP
jgi:hypothetical protein